MKPPDDEQARMQIIRELSVIEALAKQRGLELPDRESLLYAKTVQALRERYRDRPAAFAEEQFGVSLHDDLKQLLQSVRDNRVTVALSANAIGKTFTSGLAAWWFWLMWEDAQVYTTAAPPERNLKRLLWGEINAFAEKHPWITGGSRLLSLHIGRSAKSFITGVTIPQSGTPEQREAKFAGKHAPQIFFIVDEGDGVPDEVYRGIESCMSGAFDRLLILLNPRAQQGAVWRMIRDGKANVIVMTAFAHPNVLTGRNLIPGAVTRETTVRRINEWSRPLVEGEEPDADCFEVPEFLVGSVAERPEGGDFAPLPSGWREVREPELWYMTLAKYPTQSEYQLISRAAVYAARSRWDTYVAQHGNKPPEGTRPIMGFDVAEFGPDENVVFLRHGGWVEPAITWRGVDPDEGADRGATIYKDKKCYRAGVDAIGVGAGVAPKMRRNGCRSAQSVKVSEKPTKKLEKRKFGLLRDQLMWEVREWLEKDPGAMLPPDELLIEELVAVQYRTDDGPIKVAKKKVLREKLKRSPNRFDSLALTFAPERQVLYDFIKRG